MATLTVGVGEEFSTLSAAVAASHNGDTIQVKAGTYVNDFATVTDSITIESVGGMANFVATEPPTNLKAILTVGSSSPSNIDVTVDGLSFSGAAISAADGANAAGIKEQSGNLTVENCLFQHNQMGILTGNLASSSITVEHSEFGGQSTLPGYLAHQLYVGQIGSAVIENNLFLANDSGHQIKDRAATSLIQSNIIDDGSGHTSYDIDLPNGGNATVSGNQIIKGANDPNTTVISYGEEGMIWSSNSLSVTGNTIDNKLTGNHGIGIHNYSSVVAHIDDNRFYHLPTVASGPNEQTGNITLTSEPTISDTNPIQLTSSSSKIAAQPPILSVSATSGTEGNAIPLTITAKQAASTLSPSDLSVTVSNLDGATLNHGTHNANGSYTLHAADLSGLTITPSTGFVGTIALQVVATDTEPSSNTSASSTPDTLDVTVTGSSGGSTGQSPPPSSQPPLSPNGAELTPGSSAELVTSDGTWTFSSDIAAGGNVILLNGHPAGDGAAKTLVVEHGHLFADNAQGTWFEWANSGWTETGNPTGSSGTTTANPPASLSPDGTSLTAESHGSLVTSDGTWSFGSSTAPGGHEILLNGHVAGNGAAATLLVEQGHLFADNAQGNWYEWVNSNWVHTTDPLPSSSSGTSDPPPALSPDGSTLIEGSHGSLVTSDGTWTFSTATATGGNVILLNGSPALNGAATNLVVEQGHLYADNAQGHWYEWMNSTWNPTTNPISPTSSPVQTSASATTLAPTFSDGAGHDIFIFKSVPNATEHIANFTPADILDLAPLLKAAGYTGTNPIGDHVVTLAATGSSSTTVMVDPTGHDPNHGHVLVTLDHVTPQNMHAANIWT